MFLLNVIFLYFFVYVFGVLYFSSCCSTKIFCRSYSSRFKTLAISWDSVAVYGSSAWLFFLRKTSQIAFWLTAAIERRVLRTSSDGGAWASSLSSNRQEEPIYPKCWQSTALPGAALCERDSAQEKWRSWYHPMVNDWRLGRAIFASQGWREKWKVETSGCSSTVAIE